MKYLVQCSRCMIGLIVVAVLGFGTAERLNCAELPGKGVTVQPVDGGIPGEVFQLEIIIAGLKRLGYMV